MRRVFLVLLVVAIGFGVTRFVQTSRTRNAVDVLVGQNAKIAIQRWRASGSPSYLYVGAPTGRLSRVTVTGYTMFPGATIVSVSLPKIQNVPATLSAIGEFPELQVLGLNDPQICDESLRVLSAPKMVGLDLGGSSVTGAGLPHLERFIFLKGLRLTNLNIQDADLLPLLRLRSLCSLELNKNQIGDDGVVQLLILHDLTTLDLSDTNVSDEGLLRLQELKRLCVLDVTNTKVTAAGIKQFQESRPECRIKSNATGDDAIPAVTTSSPESN
jgi:hypothetical protein